MTAKSGIPWRGAPRPYDLRHAFASRSIIRWIDSGKNVMQLLPYLSAYMGHSKLTSTLYYVHLLLENLRRSKGIDWDFLSHVYRKGVLDDEDQGKRSPAHITHGGVYEGLTFHALGIATRIRSPRTDIA